MRGLAISAKQIKKLHQINNLEGLDDEEFKEKIDCDVCARGKKVRKKFNKKNEIKTKERGEIIHSDVCGPIFPTTHGGNKYFVSFIDDYTRMSWVFMMRKKSEVVEKFKQFQKMLLTQFKIKIKSLLSDEGGEYVNDEMKEFMKEEGMIHRTTPPYTPQRNGVSERYNRTVMEKMRCMLKGKEMEYTFWGEAVSAANQLRNKSPTSTQSSTPYQEFTGEQPNLNKLKIFGTRVMTKDNSYRRKLEDRTREGILLSYCEENKTYRVWDIERRGVIFSRDFVERKEITKEKSQQEKEEKELEDKLFEYQLEEEEDDDENERVEVEEEVDDDDDLPDLEPARSEEEVEEDLKRSKIQIINLENDEEEEVEREVEKPKRKITTINLEEEDEDNNNIQLRRSTRDRRPTVHSEFNAYNIELQPEDVPNNYYQMLRSKEREKWLEATKKELDSLKEMKTWRIEERKKQPTITARWLWKVKIHPDGSIDKYKTRLVARGFRQIKGINYEETFAPVVRFETIRYLLAYAVQHELPVHHMDVETAFLNGELEEEIYLEIPEGLKIEKGELKLKNEEDYRNEEKKEKKEKNEKVLKLQKSIYGLKQSPRCWNKRITSFLNNNKYIQSQADPCLFIKEEENKEITIIAIYVDDVL